MKESQDKKTSPAPQDPPAWKRMRFKNNKVWVAVDPKGTPLLESGKHLVKYQLNQEMIYRVHAQNVTALEASAEKPRKAGPAKPKSHAPSASKGSPAETSGSPSRETIHVFTDGASSGNPGPAGIGVLLRFGNHEKQISRFIGHSTNNIAELEAIRVGLCEIGNLNLPVVLYTDSNYAFGLLTQNWKAKKNQDLVAEIRGLISRFRNLRFVKVRGHAGDEGNEIADRLATSAIREHSQL